MPKPVESPEVRLQHGVAAVGEKLRERVVPPHVARPRPAVRQDDQREPLRCDAFRQRQVGRDRQAVRGGIADRRHGGEHPGREGRTEAVLKREGPRSAIEEVGRAGVDIAPRAHEEEAFVERRGAELDLPPRQLRLQERVVRLERLLPPVDALPVVHVDRRDQAVGAVGEMRRAQVDPLQGIRFHHGLGPGPDVEQRQTDEVAVALVGLQVDAGAVLVELHRAARLEDAAGIDLRQPVPGVHAQDLGVAVLGRARDETQGPTQVEDVAAHPLGVPQDQCPLPGRDLHLVEVVPRGLAVVEAHEDRVRFRLRHGVDHRPDPLRIRQVPRGRDPGRRCGRCLGAHAEDVVVLVPTLVLGEEDEPAIARPEELRDRAAGVGGERPGLCERLPCELHPDVQDAFERFQERDELPVRGNLRAGDLRVAEELLSVDQRQQSTG